MGGVELIPFRWPAVLALRKCEAFLIPWALVLGLVVIVSVCESRGLSRAQRHAHE